jgi:hypothetical protein
MGQQLRSDAQAGIAHPEEGRVPVPFEPQFDSSAVFAVLGGVVEEVGDHLDQPDLVSLDAEVLRRERHDKPLLAGLDERLIDLHRALDDRREVHRVFLQLDLAAGDARDIQEVVH